ncbi:hypothetical protein [Streptomyces sp. NBC_01497]|uniref:hypothetical protein n=1 Tax=Streptomyces sp. NBC_01497 TaxID=2903885 RepID=UPI002E33440E|nr:hypothetical protein [Streptomyces sp. NBC_01497]
MITGYVAILPAATLVCWILSWWKSRWLRWGVLGGAAVASVLCYFISFQAPGGVVDPAHGCPMLAACGSWDGVYWLETGVFTFVLVIILWIVTLVVNAWRGTE